MSFDIEHFSEEFERLDELPEIWEFMENMHMEVRASDMPQTRVKNETNSPFTTG
jgi:hypothetical protein